ncbi:MAG: DUF308 domain-containing protein [Bacteroidota bacterium]
MKERILLIALLAIVLSACSPKYTASFGPSRNFHEPEQLKIENPDALLTDRESLNEELTSTIPEESVVEASTTGVPTVSPSRTTRTEQIVQKYTEEGVPSTKEVLKLPTKEKVKLLTQVKKDIKALKKAKKNNSLDNKKVYAGIIIALAGIVVAILASGALGGLAIIVGVALIAWGLIEEGSL